MFYLVCFVYEGRACSSYLLPLIILKYLLLSLLQNFHIENSFVSSWNKWDKTSKNKYNFSKNIQLSKQLVGNHINALQQRITFRLTYSDRNTAKDWFLQSPKYKISNKGQWCFTFFGSSYKSATLIVNRNEQWASLKISIWLVIHTFSHIRTHAQIHLMLSEERERFQLNRLQKVRENHVKN